MTNTRLQNEQNAGERSDETRPQDVNEDEQRHDKGTAPFIPSDETMTGALRPPTDAPATPQTSLTQSGRRRR